MKRGLTGQPHLIKEGWGEDGHSDLCHVLGMERFDISAFNSPSLFHTYETWSLDFFEPLGS